MRLVILMSCLPFFAIGQQGDWTSITNALAKGNANTVSTYFANNVELSLPGDEGVYDKVQAKNKLTSFFSKNIVSSFSQVHQGSSKGNAAKYFIGNLQTQQGSFRVYVFVDTAQNRYTIQELRIE